MRQTIRAAQQEGFERIAVVCGAWHAPALAIVGDAKADADAARRACKRIKVEATWIPWTYSRLAYRSGYGAGVALAGLVRAPLDDAPDRARDPLDGARGAAAARARGWTPPRPA